MQGWKEGRTMSAQCEICPRGCVLEEGEAGNCRARKNIGGKITLTTYGFPCAVHVDPVEKKPMFHFLPGTTSFSIATAGCNLHCRNCQNWEISQAKPEDVPAYDLPPDKVVAKALEHKCASIAYTYTDPVIFYEYARDCSIKAREKGLKNILVTAGYINQKPLKEICKVTDGANIDLKAYSDKFYRDVCKGTLKPVLDALVTSKKCGVEVEVTNLVLPTLNDSDDDFKNLSKWVKENMGAETPLHFSKFHPDYLMKNLPPTPGETLFKAREIAKSEGLKNVYIGNLASSDGENTYCPECGKLLIKRTGFSIDMNEIKAGHCPKCSTKIYGVWK